MNLKRVYEIIEKAHTDDLPSKIFDISIVILIILNVVSVILESINELSIKFNAVLEIFEIISVIIFTIEYILRALTSKYKYPDKKLFIAYIKNILSFILLIDLFAILPFYLPFFISVDLRFLRILRLVRIVRILKIHRYTESFNIIGRVLKNKKEELILTFFVSFLLLTLASSIMYYVETDFQPDEFPNILAAFWWGIATLTTVGYGDVFPVTVLGKILSGIIAFIGIGLVALPTGIISSGFIEELQNKKQKKEQNNYCPRCGTKLE